jgi:hypothetical protein
MHTTLDQYSGSGCFIPAERSLEILQDRRLGGTHGRGEMWSVSLFNDSVSEKVLFSCRGVINKAGKV